MTTTLIEENQDVNEVERGQCRAFEGSQCIAAGSLADVAFKTKQVIDQTGRGSVLIFDETTSQLIEIDFRGTVEEVLAKLQKPGLAAVPGVIEKRGPGRPKLGVVAREVTLLPRHWDWLAGQPGGASVALRRLVEEAKRGSRGKDQIRASQEAVHRFMTAMAGNLPGFEEALRAFYAGNVERFDELVEPWPLDIRDHAKKLIGVWRMASGK